MEEVSQHNTKKDCWVACDGKVYDVTSWISRHPGGELIILSVAGRDITDAFLVNHGKWVRDSILPLYQIGYVNNYRQSEVSRDFCDLHVQLENSMFYQTSYWFYTVSCFWYMILIVCGVSCVLWGNGFLVRCIFSSIFMGIFWQQIAFFGHDLGHMAFTHNRVIDNMIGVLGGNALMGIALGWWKATHNVHHIVTNYLENDPDIQHLPIFAISPQFFKGIFSKYHERRFEFDAVCQALIRYQHIMFYPVMFFARFNLCLQSILLLVDVKRSKRYGVHWPYLELFSLGLYYFWLSRLIYTFPSWPEAVTFLLLSHGVAGILHVQICLSHFSMEVLQQENSGEPLEKLSFAEHQLRTSLDVDCHPFLDWFHGGLQFQTTHHLFPLAPRHKLRSLAENQVAQFCTKHKFKYWKVTFLEGNMMCLNTLKETASQIHPWFASLINCRG